MEKYFLLLIFCAIAIPMTIQTLDEAQKEKLAEQGQSLIADDATYSNPHAPQGLAALFTAETIYPTLSVIGLILVYCTVSVFLPSRAH